MDPGVMTHAVGHNHTVCLETRAGEQSLVILENRATILFEVQATQ